MLTVAAIPVAMPTVLSVTMAVGARLLAEEEGDRQPAGGDRGTRRRGCAVRGQDRHADAEQADAGRAVLRRGVAAADVVLAGALASRADNQDTIDLAVLGGLKDTQALKATR